MRNEYLETLGLNEGASKDDVKKAYRKLAKVYHPDVSKDPNAKLKFIAVNEAYKFLTLVGSQGFAQVDDQSHSSYEYDIRDNAYEAWRRKAQSFAREQAREAERQQQELTKSLLRYFDWAMIFVVAFNLLLWLDDSLAVVETQEQLIEINIFDEELHHYDELIFDQHHFKFESRTLDPMRRGRFVSALVSSTPIFDIPKYVDIEMSHGVKRYDQHAGILGFFGFLVQVILLCYVLFKVVIKTLDIQLTVAVVIVFSVAVQIILFLTT